MDTKDRIILRNVFQAGFKCCESGWNWEKANEWLNITYPIEQNNNKPEKTAENNNWPDEVRLKMIEKSEFYPDDKQVYQYGFYDGFQYARSKEINLRDELIKFRESFVKSDGILISDMDIDDYLKQKQ